MMLWKWDQSLQISVTQRRGLEKWIVWESLTVPILDFWGPYANLCHRGGGRSRKALEKQYLFRGSVRFKLFFFFFLSRARDCTTFTLHDLTDFYVERVTAHRIKRNEHSCFHNRWPNSKTKLRLKHLWEQGGPLVFRGPYAVCVFCV